jgi:hypothetical protein
VMSLSSVERRSQPSSAPVKVVVDVRSTCITENNNVGGRPARGINDQSVSASSRQVGHLRAESTCRAGRLNWAQPVRPPSIALRFPPRSHPFETNTVLGGGDSDAPFPSMASNLYSPCVAPPCTSSHAFGPRSPRGSLDEEQMGGSRQVENLIASGNLVLSIALTSSSLL